MGIERIFLNCGGCHVGSVRAGDGAEAVVIAGMPSNTVDLSAFQGFLARAAVDERFSADRFLAEIDALGLELDPVNRLALRLVGVGMVRERLLAIVDRFDDFVGREPTFGPGRFDTFNPAKALLDWDIAKLPEREWIGVVDFPAIFMQGAKDGMQLHWDGNNTKVSERNRSAAFGTGATPPILDRESLGRMEAWIDTAEPPRFTDVFPGQFDAGLAEQGAPVYARECAACHGASGRDFTGEQVGKVTPIGEIGTDRARLDNYTHDLAVNQNVLYAEYGAERFQTFRKTHGYANAPLDGVWLRAPYLHNGSVPDMAALLVAAGGAAAGVPARLRRLRSADARLRQRPGADRSGAARAAVLLHDQRRGGGGLPGGGAADERDLRRRGLPRQRQRRASLRRGAGGRREAGADRASEDLLRRTARWPMVQCPPPVPGTRSRGSSRCCWSSG